MNWTGFVEKLALFWQGICGRIEKLSGAITEDPVDSLKCDILLFFATKTEREQLEKSAAEIGLPFEERSDPRVGTYYTLGTIGPNRVRAVKTRMGPFFHQGSASQAIILRAASSATSIIQVGMAFGIDRAAQKHGDVLVSQWLFPYDYRIIDHIAGAGGQQDHYVIDYRETQRFRPKQSLLNLCEREASEGAHEFKTHFGGVLSGDSRIFSQLYLRELLLAVTGGNGPGGYVGGEMEGVGLLAASKKAEPVWLIVKGISDFADDQRHGEINANRPEACLNAARFVLAALKRADKAIAD